MIIDIARAWKDAHYRNSLNSQELAQLPQNPIGTLELTDIDLATISGACGPDACNSLGGLGLGLNLGVSLNACGGGEEGGCDGGWYRGYHRHYSDGFEGGSCDPCDPCH